MKDPLGAIQQLVPDLSGKHATTHGGEYFAPCPFTRLGLCNSRTDAFRCWPYREDGNPTVWWCRKATNHPKSGDLIELVRLLAGGKDVYLSYHEACDWLEMTEEERNPLMTQYRPRTSGIHISEAPSVLWQQKAERLILDSQYNLWNTELGEEVLGYLREDRGLSDSVIRALHIGLHPEEEYFFYEQWDIPTDTPGKRFRVPMGIVFPCIEWETKTIWSLVIRQPDGALEGDPSGTNDPYWLVRSGDGTGNGLFLADTVKPDGFVIMVESYIDAATVLDAIYADEQLKNVTPPIGVVATRSTTGARLVRWLTKLQLARGTLQCFDGDDGGDEGAYYWMDRLTECLRWSPKMIECKDINEAKLKGRDIAHWLKLGLIGLSGDSHLFDNYLDQSEDFQNVTEVSNECQETPQNTQCYICVRDNCRNLVGVYQHLPSGHYCLMHLWEAPELKEQPRVVIKYEANQHQEAMLAFVCSFLVHQSFAQQLLCFGCDKKPVYMDFYGRVWCDDHCFAGCAPFNQMPLSIEDMPEEEWSQAPDHCHLCMSEDVVLDVHGALWCAIHSPYLSWSLHELFPWILQDTARMRSQIAEQRAESLINQDDCDYYLCNGLPEHHDQTTGRWCEKHFWSYCLMDCGARMNWQTLYVPAREGSASGTIQAGRENWYKIARTGGSNFLFAAQAHAWLSILGESVNAVEVRYPCQRHETAGCNVPTNTQGSYMDNQGQMWCHHCRSCGELLDLGEEMGWIDIHGSHRWEKGGHMIFLQGAEEYGLWAYTLSTHECYTALQNLKEIQHEIKVGIR